MSTVQYYPLIEHSRYTGIDDLCRAVGAPRDVVAQALTGEPRCGDLFHCPFLAPKDRRRKATLAFLKLLPDGGLMLMLGILSEIVTGERAGYELLEDVQGFGAAIGRHVGVVGVIRPDKGEALQ